MLGNQVVNRLGKINGLTNKKAYCLCFYLVLMGVLELLAYGGNKSLSVFLSRIWLATGLLLLLALLGRSLYMMIKDIRGKNYCILFFWFLLLAFYGHMTFSLAYSDVNPDATQQVAAGLDALKMPDWNYTGTAFLGYAGRQYVIAALPTLILGRSINSLHLGFGLLFLIGLTEYFFEMRCWLAKRQISEKTALLPVYSLLGFRFIIEYYMNFEQAITPVALTLLGTALFLRNLRKPDMLSVVALAWVGAFCANSYTPAMATLALLLVCIGGRILELLRIVCKKKKNRKDVLARMILLGGTELNMILCLLATLLAGRSDRIDSFRREERFMKLAGNALLSFFTDENATFLGFFISFFFIYMLLALLGKLRFYDFLVAGWIICVIVFATCLRGYSDYAEAWLIQRNMIVIPVFVTAVFIALVRFFKNNKLQLKAELLPLALLVFLGLGYAYSTLPHQSFTYFASVKPMKFMFQYTSEVCGEWGLDAEDEFILILCTDNVFQKNLQDYCVYFYPNAHTYMPNDDIPPAAADNRLVTIVFGETEEAVEKYQGQLMHKTFVDKRYGTEHTWYVKVCDGY